MIFEISTSKGTLTKRDLKMTQYPFTMADFMRTLKPVKTCNFMDMCASYLAEAKEAYNNGESDYEISGHKTKSRNPVIIFRR